MTFPPHLSDTEFRYIIKLRRCPQWEGEIEYLCFEQKLINEWGN